jgi:hypothetical protein
MQQRYIYKYPTHHLDSSRVLLATIAATEIQLQISNPPPGLLQGSPCHNRCNRDNLQISSPPPPQAPSVHRSFSLEQIVPQTNVMTVVLTVGTKNIFSRSQKVSDFLLLFLWS